MIRIKKPKIGLALGSGAARGLAHIGVLKALKERDISIDMIAGSSMGALVAAYYARKGEIANLEEIVLKVDWKQLVRLLDPNLALLFKGVIHGKKVKELLKTLIGDVEFKDLKIPLAVVAADVNTGEEIIMKENSVIEAVRASISIPAIFMPIKLKNRFLMDGGIVNPVPVNVVRDMGATFIIASNVIRKPHKRAHLDSLQKKKRIELTPKNQVKNKPLLKLNSKINKLIYDNQNRIKIFQELTDRFKKKIFQKNQKISPDTPNIFDTILQALYVMEYEIAKSKIKGADVIISPDVKNIAALEFYKAKKAISEGYKAAIEMLS